MTTAVKLSDELVAAARTESKMMSRSMTQQIEHWARVGRAVERMPAVTHENVRSALRGELPFDALSAEERAVVLGEMERIVLRPAGTRDLHREMRTAGIHYTVLDENGQVVEIAPDGSRHVLAPEHSSPDTSPRSAT